MRRNALSPQAPLGAATPTGFEYRLETRLLQTGRTYGASCDSPVRDGPFVECGAMYCHRKLRPHRRRCLERPPLRGLDIIWEHRYYKRAAPTVLRVTVPLGTARL